MQDHSNLSVLIVDPNPGMRGSLHNMLAQAQITKVEFAVSSGTAIRQLGKKPYDIILCEYDLGSGNDGQDGQQLLEDLRHHRLIGLFTIFIMITSEGVYSKVVSAAELTPTDYILKPFTVDVLSQRIEKALERRIAFLPTYQLIGQGNLREAIKSCATAEANMPRYAADFARLRAELHASLGENADAAEIYQAVINAKPVGWAHLGLAKTLFAEQKITEAQGVLTKLVADNPRFMNAYDWLSKCYEASGEPAAAQKILEDAVAISPHMVRRLRHLGEVALDAGDVAAAERSFKQVVAKAKYSEFRDPEDHVNLVKALVRKGDTSQAAGVIRDLEKSLRGNPATEACMAISAALVEEAGGNAENTAKRLTAAVTAAHGNGALSSHLKVDLAKACLNNHLDKEAAEVMLDALSDSDGEITVVQAMNVFTKAGRPDLAEGMTVQIKSQVQELMAEAVAKTEAGDIKGSVHILLGAVRKAPGNLQLLFATVTALLKQLNELGWDHPTGEHCHATLETIRKLDPAHPMLVPLTEQYAATQRKFGIAN